MGGVTAATAHDDRIQAVREFALAQPLRRVAAVLFGGIAIIALLGTLHKLGAPLGLFDFDGEGKPPAAWSALVLLAGGTVSFLIATMPDQAAWRKRYLGLGAFLVFMAVDEAITLHELASAATGVAWQPLWLPLIALGGVAWLLVLARLWALPRERTFMILGAAAWFVSQVLEQLQSNEEEGRVEGYGLLSSLEEILEVTGSALFVLALLGTLHILHARRAGAVPGDVR